MQFASGFTSSAAPSLNVLKDMSNLSPATKSHLTKVYQTLATTVLASAVGAYAHVLYHLGGLLSLFASLFLLFAIHSEVDIRRKYAMLLGFGFLQGLTVGPLVEALLQFDPSIITTAFLSASAMFACFTVSAMLAERRSMLFLGAFLSSAMSMMGIIALMNLFMGNPAIAGAQLWLGLFIFCGFVLYDTQLIIEKANRGNRDYVRDALELFLDFVQLFVRIALILAKDKKKKRNDN